MQKKSGFTLAEVLLVLGIIGVVAALTAPTLVKQSNSSRIGPTLQKIVSTLEVANEQMLTDGESNDLMKVIGQSFTYHEDGTRSYNDETPFSYYEALTNYIKGSSYERTPTTFVPDVQCYDENKYKAKDNSISNTGANSEKKRYPFRMPGGVTLFMYPSEFGYNAKGAYKGVLMTLYIDINGEKVKPNIVGKDIFYLKIDRNGSVIPYGGSLHSSLAEGYEGFPDGVSWNSTKKNDQKCNESYVGTGNTCAGSIFDHDLKVIYQ